MEHNNMHDKACQAVASQDTQLLLASLQLNGEPLKVDICKHKLTDKHPEQTQNFLPPQGKREREGKVNDTKSCPCNFHWFILHSHTNISRER